MTRLFDAKMLRDHVPLGRTKLYELMRQVRHVRIGGRLFIREDDFEELIERLTIEGERYSPGKKKN